MATLLGYSRAVRRWLLPLSGAYGRLIELRNAYFDYRRTATTRVGVPVISVGNLTVGGTGKTPLVMELARRLQLRGQQPAILSRGYAGRSGELADEVREYGIVLPDVPVVVNRDRVAGGRAAVEQGATVLILDDGFQHRRLARDIDIVVIDALDPWGGGRLLPAGNLREPVTGLRRADWVVITRTNQVPPAEVQEITATVTALAPGALVLKAAVEAEQVIGLNGHAQPPAGLLGRRVLPVCGVGNPASFIRALTALAADATRPVVLPDHHRYTQTDVRRILRQAIAAGADLVVTTRKDWVKLHSLWPAAPDSGAQPRLVRLDTRLALADPRGEVSVRLANLIDPRTPGAEAAGG